MNKSSTDNKGFMYRLSEGIVGGRYIMIALFVAAIIFSCFSIPWVQVEEDITYYLQDTAEAKKGLVLMNNEFITYATAQVMVEDVTAEQADGLYDTLTAMDGIVLVDYAPAEDFKDGCALYNVTFSGTPDKQECIDAYANVKQLLSTYKSSIYSESFETMVDIFVQEMSGVVVIVVIVVIAVLIFTSSTYGEILVLLLTFLAAAVINMGTNFLLGTISVVSNSVAIVLQLALSVDYAIIFCNRYKEEHELLPVREAVISSLSKSIPAISASSLTTIAGLAAMTFMEFKLGLDMGIALIKSIVLSLVTVFLFMPALLVIFGKFMDRTKHKNFVPKVPFLGRFAYASRYVIPPIFVALAIFAYILYGNINYGYAMDIIENAHKNDQDIALENIESHFGKNNFLAVMIPAGDYEKEAAFSEELAACDEVSSILGLATIDAINGYKLADKVGYQEIMELAEVDETAAKALITYSAADKNEHRELADDLESYKIPIIDMFMSLHDLTSSGVLESMSQKEFDFEGFEAPSFEMDPEQLDMVNELYEQLSMARDQLQGENYSRLLVYINLPNQGEDTFAFLDRVHSIALQYYDEGAVLTGNAVSAKDFSDAFTGDNRIVSTLSIVLVMIILFFTFRSVGMPILLILVIQGSIWMNFAIAQLRGEIVFFMCTLIVSSIQMGANIDYAIVISSRYTELRDQKVPQKDAIIDTLNLAFPTVITSGTMMVVAGLMIGQRVSQCIIAGMGKYVGIGTAISLLLVNFALPQILILGDGFARATTIKTDGIETKLINGKGKRIAAGILAAATLAVLVASPIVSANAKLELSKSNEQTESMIAKANELRELSLRIEKAEKAATDTKTDFTEHVMTEVIGTEALAEGEVQYEEGAAEIAKYKKLLAEGKEQYKEGVAQYEAGLAAYNEAKAQVEAGQAQYDAGQIQYQAAKDVLAQGYADYEAGQQQLEAGKAAAAVAEPLVAPAKALYESARAAYDAYLDQQNRYDVLASSKDPSDRLRAAAMLPAVLSAKVYYESSFNGKSVTDLMSDYYDLVAQLESSKQQVADGERQLAEAEAALAASEAQIKAAEEELIKGKAELDLGYEQLNAGKAQLDAAKQQLLDTEKQIAEGSEQLKEGQNELGAGKRQLNSGEKMLDENREKLSEDLDSLDNINDEKQRLNAGVDMLLATDGIAIKTGVSTTKGEICSLARQFFEDQQKQYDKEAGLTKIVSALMAVAAVTSFLTLVLWFLASREDLALYSALATVVLAFSGAITWQMGCKSFGQLLFWIAVALTLAAAIAAEFISKSRKQAA